MKAIKYNDHPCNELDELWQAFYQSYNMAQDRPINSQLLDKVPSYQNTEWPLFSKVEFINAISKYNDLSTLGPDHIF